MRHLFSLILFLSCSFLVMDLAHCQTSTFNKIYDVFGGSGSARSVTAVNNGYVVGGIGETVNGRVAFSLLKVDQKGKVLWQKPYYPADTNFGYYTGSPGSFFASKYDQYFVDGSVTRHNEDSTELSDNVLMKFDKSGDSLLVENIGIPGEYDGGNYSMEMPNGDYVITGKTSKNALGANNRLFVTRTDSNGNIEWHHVYNRVLQDYAGRKVINGMRLHLDHDGDILVSAEIYGTSSHLDDPAKGWMLELDADSGTIKWDRTVWPSSRRDGASMWQPYAENKYFVYQSVDIIIKDQPYSFNDGIFPIYIGMLDSNKQFLWKRFLHSRKRIYYTEPLPDGNILLIGVKFDSTRYDREAGWIEKIDSTGNSIRERTYVYNKGIGPDAPAYFYNLTKADDNGFIVSGFTFSQDPMNHDMWLVKLDSTGCLEPGCDTTTTSVVDLSPDYYTSHVAPNPFTEKARITIQLPAAKAIQYNNYKCRVYNTRGQKVRRLKPAQKSSSLLQFQMVREKLPGGIYVYKVVAGHEILAKGKMVVE